MGPPNPRVPLGTLLKDEIVLGPQSIIRYNLYPTAQLPGRAKPGVSSKEAINAMEEVAKDELPPTMGFEWTALSYQEKRASGSAFSLFEQPIAESFLVFGLAVLLVYLVLAALYESWLLPFSVILVVPLGLLGVVAAVNLRVWLHSIFPNINTMDNNIYTQIGVVLIIALASKNAILIVEFRARIAARRSVCDAGRGGSIADAVPADCDDEFRVHSGRIPAGVRERGRRRKPSVARNRGVRWDDYIDRAGGVLRAGVLRGDSIG